MFIWPKVYIFILTFIAMYFPGERVYYDRLVENENYLWASYIGSASGKRRYVAIGMC